MCVHVLRRDIRKRLTKSVAARRTANGVRDHINRERVKLNYTSRPG